MYIYLYFEISANYVTHALCSDNQRYSRFKPLLKIVLNKTRTKNVHKERSMNISVLKGMTLIT